MLSKLRNSKDNNVNQNSIKNSKISAPGIMFLCTSIAFVITGIYLSFSGDGFYANLFKTSIKSAIYLLVASLFAIINSFSIKDRCPVYYKYQLIGALILLISVLYLDIIPRMLF